MSGPDRNASDELEPDSDAVRARIEQELAALGEDPLDGSAQDELALEFALGGGSPHADLDVATLQTLAGWAETPSPAQDDALSELAQARVWRTIELRGKKSVETQQAGTDVAAERSSRPLWVGAVALLAVAAGVILVPLLTTDQPAPARESARESSVAQNSAPVTAEELEVLSMQARTGLAALDRLRGEPTGTARVEALAADYAGRLEAQRRSPDQAANPNPREHQG